jgi:thiol-disulfide isomerase/thioredoxin
MVERIVFTVILLVVGVSVFYVSRYIQLRRIAALSSETDEVRRRLQPGIPAIIYFTTPNCIPCRVQQQPALRALQSEIGSEQLQIVQIDATQEPEIANRWGVLTAPTTFILDAGGTARTVNYGVADQSKLKHQLSVI